MMARKHANGKLSTSTMGDLMTPERKKHLTAIDQLRELGLNEEISLPQLVVVGDQSSGKSSLLEGVTGFSFPVASDLCTRFATQIVMRRSEEENASISIIPGPESRQDGAVRDAYEKFGKDLPKGDLSPKAFGTLQSEAARLMGLPTDLESSAEPDAKRFSDDVLKIEMSGPDHHNLSVVDVPGLFHNPTKYQTVADLNIIRSMIDSYMKDQRTIIMAVMDARNNLANQEVFEMARSADPDGTRTVAVITKCDALQDGDEKGVLKIARNEVEKLRYGWYVVRNRSTKEIQDGVTIAQRHENEKVFFNTNPWNQLPADHRGVPALKAFLGDLLYDHIRREFPQVVADIEKRYQTVREEMDNMGPPRKTKMEQRQYLTRFASVYQKAVHDALRGNYDPSLEANHPLKLRMRLRKVDDIFEKTIRDEGHSKLFCDIDNTPDEEFRRVEFQDEPSIYDWIRDAYRDSRGAELPGTVNPLLLENLFRQLTSPWEKISSKYLHDAETVIREFTEAAHSQIIQEEGVRTKLLAQTATRSSLVTQTSKSDLQRLLSDERGGILQTLNHYFADTLQNIRQDRVLSRFKKMVLQDGMNDLNLKDLMEAAHLSNEDQAVNDIHDILKAYYKVAQKRFMDNVLLTIRERRLIGEQSALKTFTPDFVSGLEDDALSSIAEESFTTTKQREQMIQRLDMFTEALKIVRSVQ